MKQLYIEDCLLTLKRDIEYDYVITSPPDYDELNKDITDDEFSYKDFILCFAQMLNPRGNFVSICISDRKSNGRVISKHSMVIDVFESLGYILHTHKIWVKSKKANMFRLNYQHLLTFSRNKQRRKLTSEFRPDIFEVKNEKYNKYSYGMPVRIIELLVSNYTDEGDIVYDPFMGSGTTGRVSNAHKRFFVGYDIKQYSGGCSVIKN